MRGTGASPRPPGQPPDAVRSAIRAISSGDDDGVVEAILSSSLFGREDAAMLASLLAAHHAGEGGEGQRWLVDIADEEIAATVMYRPIQASDRAWDLTLLAVRAERQGAGVGQRLMLHVEQELRAQGQQTLVVQTSALPRFASARAFYVGLGYAERGHVPDYWGPRDDMVLFSKALAAPTTQPASGSELEIITVDASRLDALEPLWLQLHHHHQASLPDFAGFVTDDERSWKARRELYRRVLRIDQGFVLAAQQDERLIGYAAVELLVGADDTFAVGTRHAEVLTLVVDENCRGNGLGTRLLDEVDAALAANGIHDLVISVMRGNDRARRFYERRGLVPAETYLWRVHPATR